MPVAVSVTEGPIDTIGLLSELSKDGVGAIASFIGIVRPVNENEKVLSLEFETWDEKLPQDLTDIGNEALKKYELHSISITHRKGTVLPGEIIVCIYATSAHRAEAFAGCSWTIDELKRQAPIWKKEITQSGSYWIEGLG